MANRINVLGKRSQDESKRTQQKILDEGQRLFAQFGYGGVSIREIAKAAGVQHGTVQHHFGSKEGLYDAAVHRYDEELKALIPTLLSNQTELSRAIDQGVDIVFDFLLKRRDWVVLRVRIAIAEDQPGGAESRDSHWIEFIEAILKQNNFAPLDADFGLLIISIEAMLNYHLLADSHYQALYGKSGNQPSMKKKSKAHLKKMITAMFMATL